MEVDFVGQLRKGLHLYHSNVITSLGTYGFKKKKKSGELFCLSVFKKPMKRTNQDKKMLETKENILELVLFLTVTCIFCVVHAASTLLNNMQEYKLLHQQQS